MLYCAQWLSGLAPGTCSALLPSGSLLLPVREVPAGYASVTQSTRFWTRRVPCCCSVSSQRPGRKRVVAPERELPLPPPGRRLIRRTLRCAPIHNARYASEYTEPPETIGIPSCGPILATLALHRAGLRSRSTSQRRVPENGLLTLK